MAKAPKLPKLSPTAKTPAKPTPTPDTAPEDGAPSPAPQSLGYSTQHPKDGGFYADGDYICVRTLPGATKTQMGGSVASAQDAATAKAIVHRLTLAEALYDALVNPTTYSAAQLKVLLARAEGFQPVVKRSNDD